MRLLTVEKHFDEWNLIVLAILPIDETQNRSLLMLDLVGLLIMLCFLRYQRNGLHLDRLHFNRLVLGRLVLGNCAGEPLRVKLHQRINGQGLSFGLNIFIALCLLIRIITTTTTATSTFAFWFTRRSTPILVALGRRGRGRRRRFLGRRRGSTSIMMFLGRSICFRQRRRRRRGRR